MRKIPMRVMVALATMAAVGGSVHAETPPGLDALRTDLLRSDLSAMASAGFRGRSAGTIDELKAAAWIADRYREMGLKPAGDDGTYLQFFILIRNQLSDRSSVTLGGRSLEFGQDVIVDGMAQVQLDAPVVYLGNAAAVDLGTVDVAGKIVALEADPKGFVQRSLPSWRYSRHHATQYALPLISRGAAAVVFVADAAMEKYWADAASNARNGNYDLEDGPAAQVSSRAPILWVRAKEKAALEAGGVVLGAQLFVSRYPYPSVNVIGYVEGTDPALKNEYLLYSGHTDAHGVRNPINGDDIYYGADDNASVNVAMFAAARSFVAKPARRSVLFVIHGAEERGLLGSKHFVKNPTVPLSSIVAVLNGDMIGRGAPGVGALMGAVAPHRNSVDLVAWAREANEEGPRLTIDTSWDDPKHNEVWYFRSDHVPYARAGIPAVMYSTNLHDDYHTPRDNAANIDYTKLAQMTEWMYRTGWKVANAPQRPGGDPEFKLER